LELFRIVDNKPPYHFLGRLSDNRLDSVPPPVLLPVIMRLQSLTIDNFRVIRTAHLEFPDSVIGIIGPNGAGKSSIVEAVAWTLYGNTVARSGKDEIKSAQADTGDTCEVRLSFMLHGEHYTAVRRLVGRTGRPEALLYHDDTMISTGSTETLTQVEQLLGLDQKGFLTSFLARQQELNTLSDLAPHKRRDHLAGMLGIERLDKAITRVKEDLRVAAEKCSLLEEQVRRRDELSEHVAQLREHVLAAEKQRDSEAGARDKAKQELDAVTAEYREHETRRDACSRLEAAIKGRRETAEHIAGQLKTLRVEIAGLEQIATRIPKLQEQLADLPTARTAVEQMNEKKNRQLRHDDLTAQIKRLEKDRADLSRRQSGAKKLLEQVQAELGKLPEDVDRRLQQAKDELESARSTWSNLNGDRRSRERELKRIDEQIASMRDIGPEAVCDRCRRPFGDDLPVIRNHLTGERTEIVRLIEQLDQKLAKHRTDGEQLGRRVKQLEDQSKRRVELTARLEAAKKETADFEHRATDHDANAQRLKKQINELGEATFDPKELKRLTARVAELEKLQQEHSQLTGRLARLEPAREELAKSESKLAGFNTDIGKLQTELKELAFDKEAFARLADRLAQAQGRFEQARDAYTGTIKQLELKQQELGLVQKQLQDLDAAATQLETLRTDRFYGEKLQALFTDFRKHMIASIRPRLSELSSRLMADMSGGRYSMVELDEAYNLAVFDNAQYYGVDRFSGGEKDLANLCLRLAISEALAESAGLDRSFVILDEVFGSQDSQRRELIFDGLINLKQRFPQMLLITHIEDIRDRVECLVEVERTAAGWSRVKMNGEII
jgi:exonuclease SbcC